ncbi:integrase [Halobacteriales archaeon SW_7_65_23]|nr:MAG: integrase [Halobacteriales archaeon SW_7_65_23]
MSRITQKTDENHVDGIVLVSRKARENLRQIESYREHRRNLCNWLLNLGKSPEKAEGYARSTTQMRMWRLDKFYRWIWNNVEDGYTESITTEHADQWMQHLAHQELSAQYKSDCQKSCKTLFKWKNWRSDRDIDWDPAINYTGYTGTHSPRDFVTREERRQLREAALEYGSVPAYDGLSHRERDRWKAHLAQRFGKPKSEVTPADWKKANSFKIPSLVWTSMDAGLRPIEVGRAKVSWVDLGNAVLRIPKEESSKNTENWTVPLLDRTATFLKKWLEERQQYDRYAGSDRLWLTREANPYTTQSLNHVMKRLCEIAGIDRTHRKVTWYSIRHSTGTYMAREEGLGAAQQQLRHKSERTTMKYDQAPVEDRQDALDKID